METGGRRRSPLTQIKLRQMIDSPQLTRWAANHYGLVGTVVIQMKTVCGILCRDGTKYIFKCQAVRDTEVRMQSLARMGLQLRDAGVDTAMPIPNRDGRFLSALWDESGYGYLQPWSLGRHVNFSAADERIAAVRAIGQFHRACEASRLSALPGLNNGTLLRKLRMKQRTLTQVWGEACSRCPELMSISRQVFGSMDSCLQTYVSWLSQRQQQTFQTFCHRDLAPHNLLMQADGRVVFIDFDHAGFDDPIHDVMQMASHSLFLADAQTDHFQQLYTAYTQSYALQPDRRALLWQLFAWPDVLIRTVVEWVRQGCSDSKRKRVRVAIAKERQRWSIVRSMGVHVNG